MHSSTLQFWLATTESHARTAQSPSFSRMWSDPVPKLSSPQRDKRPASIRLPKNFHPVGTSKQFWFLALATLERKKYRCLSIEFMNLLIDLHVYVPQSQCFTVKCISYFKKCCFPNYIFRDHFEHLWSYTGTLYMYQFEGLKGGGDLNCLRTLVIHE